MKKTQKDTGAFELFDEFVLVLVIFNIESNIFQNPVVLWDGALKMVAAATQEVFNGRISEVLERIEQGAFIFDDIHNLLERQFNRLSSAEQELMYWLAIKREPISLTSTALDISISKRRHLLPTIKALLQRSLIEKNGEHFFLQPVVMEYVRQRLDIPGHVETHHVETPLMESLPKTKNTNLLLGNTYETARHIMSG